MTATANDNYEFVGWKDSYGTTISTNATYNFTVIGDVTLKPEFVKVKTEEGAAISYVTVSFYHQSGQPEGCFRRRKDHRYSKCTDKGRI